MKLVIDRVEDKQVQQDILKIMEEEGILPGEAAGGICFTLILHTLEKYIRNLSAADPAKRESFPVKYHKVYEHCMKTDSKYLKHCKELTEEFKKYYEQFKKGKGQADIIRGTIADCGFEAAFQNARIEEHISVKDTAAVLKEVLENHEDAAVLLCLNTQDDTGAFVGHTVALVRQETRLSFLDVSGYLVEAEIGNGEAGKELSLDEFLSRSVLVDSKKRRINDVTLTVIIPQEAEHV